MYVHKSIPFWFKGKINRNSHNKHPHTHHFPKSIQLENKLSKYEDFKLIEFSQEYILGKERKRSLTQFSHPPQKRSKSIKESQGSTSGSAPTHSKIKYNQIQALKNTNHFTNSIIILVVKCETKWSLTTSRLKTFLWKNNYLRKKILFYLRLKGVEWAK